MKITGQSHKKAYELNFYWKICGNFFRPFIQGSTILKAPFWTFFFNFILFLFLFCFVFSSELGGVATQDFFSLTAFFSPNKLRQTLLSIHPRIFWCIWGEIWGCRYGGHQRPGGVGEIPWFLFCPFHKYFTRYICSELSMLMRYSKKLPFFFFFFFFYGKL